MNRLNCVFIIFLFIVIMPLNSGVAGEFKVYSSEGVKTLYFRDSDPSKQTEAEKTPVTAQPREAAAQPPPIAQTLVREGDFATRLVQALKIGPARSEAEAESMLTSVGIAPKNGWIADYPVTPDIIGELQNAIGGAADSGKLPMNKDGATKTLQDLTAQQGLLVTAAAGPQYAGVEPPVEPPPGDYGEYSRPEIINNYYYDQGPPIITYYPPPWDYYYMYAWVPYPFWYSRFWFPGFFVLHDFHQAVLVNKRVVRVSNHIFNPKTGRVVPIDPATRGTGKPAHIMPDASRPRVSTRPETGRGAASTRSYERTRPGNSSRPESSFRGRAFTAPSGSSSRGFYGGSGSGSKGSLRGGGKNLGKRKK